MVVDFLHDLLSPLNACSDQLVSPWASLRPSEQIVSRLHVQASEDRRHHSDDTFAALFHEQSIDLSCFIRQENLLRCGMTVAEQLRRDALRRYFIFRLKLIELFHLHLVWASLADDKFTPENVMDHSGRDFAESVRTAYLSWYCTIVDRTQGGLNVFNVWLELFPRHRDEIERVRDEVEPHLGVLRNFRDKCGFHADTPRNYFHAKQRVLDNPQTSRAVQDFLDLAKKLILLEETESPRFRSRGRNLHARF